MEDLGCIKVSKRNLRYFMARIVGLRKVKKWLTSKVLDKKNLST